MGFWQFATGGGSGGGTGDVVGPASSTDNAVARWNLATGKLLQDSGLIVSDVAAGAITVTSTAGTAITLKNTDPAATTGASVAGDALAITAGNAVASTDTAGAAAGGDVTITAGNAARNTSGSAAGGNINLNAGTPIGGGVNGQILIGTVGAWNRPSVSFPTSTTTGFYLSAANVFSISGGGTGYSFSSTALSSGNSPSFYGFKYLVEANTAGSGSPNIITSSELRTVFTNEGSGAKNYEALPTAVAGYQFTFIVQDADGMRIVANTDDTIRVIDKVTAAAGYIESTTIGSTVTLVSVNAVEWYAIAINGIWTDGTFTYDDTSLTTP